MRNDFLPIVLIFSLILVLTNCSESEKSAAPILVLATQKNFGLFTGEILKTEGFNNFVLDSLNSQRVTDRYLKGFDVVIMAQMSINNDQRKLLTDYVHQGGNLIAFRPDKTLSGLLGISPVGGSLQEAYLAVDKHAVQARSITSETLQFHGEADHYTLGTAKPIALLHSSDTTATPYPAVVENSSGKGKAIAFLYNLPESIVLTRQGNYRDAGKEMDGILGIRAMDLFTNGWVNTAKNTLNQADEQMRLLSHCIESLNATKRPIPRFWYFPDSLKCVVTLNNDGEDSKEHEFTPQFQDVDAKGARMTLYIKEVEYVSKKWVDSWVRKGFEISGHPDDTKQAPKPDWHTMDSVYKALLGELKSSYGIESMETVTNHWFVWVGHNADGSPDFAAQAKIEALNGVGLDCNYAHYDNGSTHGHFLGEFGLRQGNYTGSGLAMKFADADGKIIDIYQQLNNVYDQQYMEHKDQDGYYNAFKGLLDRSLDDEVYSTISVRAHNNEYFFSKIPLMKAIDYANSRGVPVWTERQLLDFLRAKDAASFENLQWSDNKLSFEINSPVKAEGGLTFMVPSNWAGKTATSIRSNKQETPFVTRPMKGTDYAWITVRPGANYEITAYYN